MRLFECAITSQLSLHSLPPWSPCSACSPCPAFSPRRGHLPAKADILVQLDIPVLPALSENKPTIKLPKKMVCIQKAHNFLMFAESIDNTKNKKIKFAASILSNKVLRSPDFYNLSKPCNTGPKLKKHNKNLIQETMNIWICADSSNDPIILFSKIKSPASVTYHMSLTPTATALDPPPAYSPTMHIRVVLKRPKSQAHMHIADSRLNQLSG